MLRAEKSLIAPKRTTNQSNDVCLTIDVDNKIVRSKTAISGVNKRPKRKKSTRVTVSGPYKYRQGQRDGPEDFKITGYPRPARTRTKNTNSFMDQVDFNQVRITHIQTCATSYKELRIKSL
ncbi:hypothetical protein RRG08_049530 [Elysia crispata]|uniref:Uncharacterized protein n=1 Tax=Elysia crispata TaxID=231223 RepID=A0AAE1CLT3_9GAST|nr:hypothetical protein RRG08_049530 [Elysia crispata]